MLMVKRVSRFLINKLLVRPLPGPFVHKDGYCWAASLPHCAHLANTTTELRRSPLVIYENGIPLQLAHSSLEEVRLHGQGRYSHWATQVRFSSTDNSNPNTNGRSYTYSVSSWLSRRRLGGEHSVGSLPSNHQRRDTTPEQMKADVAYAARIGLHYLDEVKKSIPSPEGKSVLEVGPGINYGCVMVLACHGMKPMVADRYLAPWEEAYHRRFYADLADELARSAPAADVSPLRALVTANGHDERIITLVASSLEELPLQSGSVDIVFSNAVVEHLYDLDSSFKQLYRITRPGGLGLHQVDFRDHRNFDRPLEYLLLEETDFQELFAQCHGECGNRYRSDETAVSIRKAGFEIVEFRGNMFSKLEYVDEFLPRLRSAQESRYRHLQADDLRVISGFFRLSKPR